MSHLVEKLDLDREIQYITKFLRKRCKYRRGSSKVLTVVGRQRNLLDSELARTGMNVRVSRVTIKVEESIFLRE